MVTNGEGVIPTMGGVGNKTGNYEPRLEGHKHLPENFIYTIQFLCMWYKGKPQSAAKLKQLQIIAILDNEVLVTIFFCFRCIHRYDRMYRM